MPARRGPALLLQDSSRDPRARRAARANRNGGIESCFARSTRTGRTVRKRTPASTRWHRPRSSSMNAPDAIALPDRVQHRSAARAADDTTKDRIDAVQVRLRGMRNEILAASGVRSGERHAHGARFIAHGIDLVANRESRAAPAVTAGIPVLHDEVRHHTMPARAVEIAAIHEVD